MHPQLRPAAISAVAEYMGVAAEFVVDDAFADVKLNTAFAGKPEYQQMYFFVCLGKHLPPEVPYAKVKEAILKATGIKA
ncbi:hypothetical protein [Variovorax sp. PCZ-1]|uniref:hypothetical protein n=1 Tax=Variovorax sp. PCZ-1 TaxID=2835533 RepID=UPI001BD12789|nr:hypothetical protein [Variovorax sp. PCZ-1]MBS7806232.1 hypothetical protein [Variovorax sp. PCZ-1]